jgi:ligand-binding sensor domain-containing protein
MRILFVNILLSVFCISVHAQYPYVKKLSYPEQLPTQRVFNILADSKGFIWIGTDKGLFRYNGRTFVFIPFDITNSKEVSYLQEDSDGTIWCMNFYNQIFYTRNDSLHRFELDYNVFRNKSTFSNVVVGKEKIWVHSYVDIYEIDKKTKKIENYAYPGYPVKKDLINSSCLSDQNLVAFSMMGIIHRRKPGSGKWINTGYRSDNMRLISNGKRILAVSVAAARTPAVEIIGDRLIPLKSPVLPNDTHVYGAVAVGDNEFWLCTASGVYRWNPETGETVCYLPNERVSDIVMDYQGNYWISTLDNGVFLCPSLHNTVIKIYNNPFLDYMNRVKALPSKEVLLGNNQGLLTQVNLDKKTVFTYNLKREVEMIFIYHDSIDNVIICNRGVFRPGEKNLIDSVPYGKAVARDRYGNFFISKHDGVYVMDNNYGAPERMPQQKFYEPLETGFLIYAGMIKLLRQKRSTNVLASRTKDGFWAAYVDGLYRYGYDNSIRVLNDPENQPVICKTMIQLSNNNLVAGTSDKGVMFFTGEKVTRVYNMESGLSSDNILKLIQQGHELWVLTDAGLDRISMSSGTVTNYLEEYGLSNIIINDFEIMQDRILFATPSGLLQRLNVPVQSESTIRFAMLKAESSGEQISNGVILPAKNRDISFRFEALHYLSPTALYYRYRLLGLDTNWHNTGFTSQLAFSRLAPGRYTFQLQALAGNFYKSAVQEFSFRISRPWWQQPWIWAVSLAIVFLLFWRFLITWKKRVINRQSIRTSLLRSQLVALRAQMNPHFLYNVLNTVQGLVYGNRKTEAGALLGNFSDLMRKMLQASDKQFLPLSDEIENIRLYLELEKARFDEGFHYNIQLSGIADTAAIFIPSLLLQPFVENAIKHGLLHKKGEKILDIGFAKTVDGIRVTIDDNGVGRKRSQEINQRIKNKPSAFATVALTERMDLFNRLQKKKIRFTITDKTDSDEQPSGTRVELLLPDYHDNVDALWDKTPRS